MQPQHVVTSAVTAWWLVQQCVVLMQRSPFLAATHCHFSMPSQWVKYTTVLHVVLYRAMNSTQSDLG